MKTLTGKTKADKKTILGASSSLQCVKTNSNKIVFALMALVALMLGSTAQAASLTHTLTTTGTTNWSDLNWTNGVPDATSAGDVATFAGVATTTLDVTGVVIGQIVKSTAVNSWVINRGAGTSITFNNTGGVVTPTPYGDSAAFLGTTGNGALTFNPDIVIANTDLEIGSVANGSITIGVSGTGAITSTSNQGLIFKVGGSANAIVNSTIGATGSSIAISNASSVVGVNGGVVLAGAIGGATGTGAPVTISNTSLGNGAVSISGPLNASVSAVTQNSATTTMTLSGSNSNYAGITTLSAGTLKLSSSTALGGNSGTLVINGGTLDSSGQVLASTNAVTANNDFTYAGSGALTLSGPVSLGSTAGARTITTTTAASNRALTLAGVVSDGTATGLTKAGPGFLILTAAATYTGTTTINAGTLQLGAGGTTGSILASSPIVDNGTLNFNRTNTVTQGTDFGTITGSGGITLSAGTLVLNSANSYSGTSSFLTAVLQLNNASNGGIGSGPVSVNNTVTQSLLPNQAISNNITLIAATFSGSNNITLNGTVTNTSGNRTLNSNITGGNALTLAGNVYLSELSGTGRTLTIAAASNTIISGTIADFNGAGTAGGLTITNSGKTTLSASNTFSGPINISTAAGTVSVSNIGVSGAASNLGTSGTINIGAAAVAGVLVYTGTGETSDKVINLAGTTGGVTIDQSGSGILKFSNSPTVTGSGAKTLTLQGSTGGAGEIAGGIANGSLATALTKAGTGAWTLSGANSYTGATTVSGGKLIVSGSLSGSVTTVNGDVNTSLSGNGAITPLVTITLGRIAPGINLSGSNTNFGSADTLKLGTTGGLTLTNARLDFDLASTAAGTSDTITTGGALSLGSTVAFTFNELTAGQLETGVAYTLISGFTGNSGFNATNLASQANFLNGNYTPTFSIVGSNLQVTFAAVPEPSTWAMMLGGMGMLGFWQRARRFSGARKA